MNIRLYLNNVQIQLNQSVVFAITKQFEDLTNPTTIINTWSKTVSIPYTADNNHIFNYIFNPDRLITQTETVAMAIYFNPHKKIDFRLQNGESILMTGYAKVNNAVRTKDGGYYNLTLYGEMGKVFYEMKKITFDKSSEETDYIINGENYVSAQLNKELIFESWNTTGQTLSLDDANTTDIIGFVPNNSFVEGFDYKNYQINTGSTLSFEETLNNTGFTEAVGIEADKVIPNGLLPREIGEYRSYLQQPYMYFNKLFQIFCKKTEEVTGYQVELNNDSGWFSQYNPYYYNLALLLKNPFKKEISETYNNSYTFNLTNQTTGINEPAYWDGREASYHWHDIKGRTSSISIVNENYEIANTDNNTLRVDEDSNVLINGFTFKMVSHDDDIRLYNKSSLKITTRIINASTNEEIRSVTDEFARNDELDESPNCYYHLLPAVGEVDTTNHETYWILQTAPISISYDLISTTEIKFRYRLEWYWNPYEGICPFSDNSPCTVKFDSLTPSNVNISLNVGKDITLNDLWNNEHNVFDEVLKWCKMFRVFIQVDEIGKKIKFIQQKDYFRTDNLQPLDWSDKVDYSKDFAVKPMSFENKYMLFNYEESDLLQQEYYMTKYGKNYGEKVLNTHYEFNSDTKSLFENVDTSINNTDNILSWTSLHDDKKIIYTVPNELYVLCKDNDKKYVKQFGNYFFWNGLQNFDLTSPMRGVQISDNTFYQESNSLRCYSQNFSKLNVGTYPQLNIMHERYGMKFLTLFNTPLLSYSIYQKLENSNGIYDLIWKKYIDERYNIQNKIVTCSLWLSNQDFLNFDFNKFVKIDNQLYVVNKIFDYDFSNETSTKVELITVQDYTQYSDNNMILMLEQW